MCLAMSFALEGCGGLGGEMRKGVMGYGGGEREWEIGEMVDLGR